MNDKVSSEFLLQVEHDIHAVSVNDSNAEKIDAIFRSLRSDYSLDNLYRGNHLSLTASENYPSRFVRALSAGMQGGFYEFAPPYMAAAGEWYFPDSGAMSSLVGKLVTLGRQMFEAQTFDWRPNGGSAAEQAILLGACSRGDGFVHFAHKDGGHFALEELARKVGISVYHFPMEDRTLLIDVDRLSTLVRDHPEIKLVILDQSFKLRWQPLLQIRASLPSSVLLSYDASHDGGLIAGGALPQPLLYGADIVHGNTHKTIPGPQKGYIAFKDEKSSFLKPVSDWLCPHLQSNSHAELITPMLIALAEMTIYGREYAQQVICNAKTLALSLQSEGMRISGEAFGFTETHQVHAIVGDEQKALKMVTETLAKAGIRANNIEIPGTNGLFGLRFGVQALTRRGLKEADMKEVARFITRAALKSESPAAIRSEVSYFLEPFPVNQLRYSLDSHYSSAEGRKLLDEVFA